MISQYQYIVRLFRFWHSPFNSYQKLIVKKVNSLAMLQHEKQNEDKDLSQSTPGKQNDKQTVNNPAQEQDHSQESNDYRRDGTQLGGTSSDSSSENVSAGTQKGGGGTGYDVNREQQEVNRQQEEMQQERSLEQIQPDRLENPHPSTNPDRENPEPDTDPSGRQPGN